jgi:hypothetical protein
MKRRLKNVPPGIPHYDGWLPRSLRKRGIRRSAESGLKGWNCQKDPSVRLLIMARGYKQQGYSDAYARHTGIHKTPYGR